jgi:RNA polymerase sigma-70 factor, ECF subfamily
VPQTFACAWNFKRSVLQRSRHGLATVAAAHMTQEENNGTLGAPWPELNRRAELLIDRAKTGDDDAFTELYGCTCRWLLARIRRLVGNAHAEDVLAEVYIQAWQELGRFDPGRGSGVAWLAVIARSRALDFLRREKRLNLAWQASFALTACGDIMRDSPENIFSALESWRLVQLHIARSLSPQERLVLGLAYFRENTHQQISDSTGIPIGTVKTTIARAKVKLRDNLGVAAPQQRTPIDR